MRRVTLFSELGRNRNCWPVGMARAWKRSFTTLMPDWPRVLLTTVNFTQNGDGTDVRLIWVPHEPSEAEIECFAGAISGLDKGMELLGELLEELQN
jgi:hypothetical protein